MSGNVFVLNTPLIRKAYTRAAILHRNQKRKTIDAPFFIHLLGVVLILIKYTSDEKTIAAAFLHDTLEDVPEYPLAELTEEFGEEIAGIVKNVSEEKYPQESQQSKKETWQQRKDGYLAGLQNASYEALMVCCADKIDNLRSLIEAYEVLGKSVWNRFNASPEQQLWFYQSVLQILSERLPNDIVKELDNVLSQLIQKKIFNC